MTTTARWLGIDVSKQQLDVVSLPDRTHWQVPNTEAGWTQLCTELQQAPPTLIVLEASGRYELGVVVALDAVALTPVVLNPLTARRFAQSRGQRAKNDRLDAELLARYAEQVRPTPRPIPSEIARQIRELLTRRQQLTEHLVMEKNRLAQATSLVRPSITALLAVLEQELIDIDRLLAAVVASDPGWQARVDQLDTVPGIAPQERHPVDGALARIGPPDHPGADLAGGHCPLRSGAWAAPGGAPDPGWPRARPAHPLSGARHHGRA